MAEEGEEGYGLDIFVGVGFWLVFGVGGGADVDGGLEGVELSVGGEIVDGSGGLVGSLEILEEVGVPLVWAGAVGG